MTLQKLKDRAHIMMAIKGTIAELMRAKIFIARDRGHVYRQMILEDAT